MMVEWSLIAGMVWVFSIILKITGLRAERSFGSNGGRVFQLLIMHSQGVFCCREYQGIWLQCNNQEIIMTGNNMNAFLVMIKTSAFSVCLWHMRSI